MKGIFIIFILLISIYSHSQNNDLNPNSRWNCRDVDGTSQCKDTYNYNLYFNGDSIINGNQYLKLYKVGYKYNSFLSPVCNFSYTYYHHFYALVRYHQNKLYTLANSTEYLFIDYNLQIGDTIKNIGFSPAFHLKIYQIDSVNINGNYLKRFFYQSTTSSDTGYVIEKIGSNHGFISEFTHFFENSKELICYSESNVTLYTEPNSNYNCQLTLNINETNNESNIFSLHPNPASNSFSIKINNKQSTPKNIIITNYLGEIVLKEPYKENNLNFSISHLLNGVYFVLIETASGTSVKKIIKQ